MPKINFACKITGGTEAGLAMVVFKRNVIVLKNWVFILAIENFNIHF